MMYHDWNYHMMDGYGLFGLLIWLALLIDLVLVGILLVKQIRK